MTLEFFNAYQSYFLTGVSVLVSVVLFLISYRQTVRARIERIRSANSALVRTLLRRVVQEGYRPQQNELIYLKDGFAREYEVRSDELFSIPELLKIIYARVTESDLIPTERRDEILAKIVESITHVKLREPLDTASSATEQPAALLRERTKFIITLGLMTSIAGTLVAVFMAREIFSPFILGVFGISVSVVALIANAYRISNKSYASLSADYHQKLARLEGQVKSALADFSMQPNTAPVGAIYDFSLSEGGDRILFNIKTWEDSTPSYLHRALASQMEMALDREEAAEAWVVVGHKKALPKFLPQAGKVKFLTVADLRRKLGELNPRKGAQSKVNVETSTSEVKGN